MFMDSGKIPKPTPGSEMYNKILENLPNYNPNRGEEIQTAEILPDPRTIKTHLPFSLMNEKLLETVKVS